VRYAIKISTFWKPLFTVFGFSSKSSYVELENGSLHFHFGTASETVPIEQVADVVSADWPFFYGLGAKLGPKGGVSYVGSRDGVVRVEFTEPRPMNVWGPFATKKAKCVTVSLEDADGFMRACASRRSRRRPDGRSCAEQDAIVTLQHAVLLRCIFAMRRRRRAGIRLATVDRIQALTEAGVASFLRAGRARAALGFAEAGRQSAAATRMNAILRRRARLRPARKGPISGRRSILSRIGDAPASASSAAVRATGTTPATAAARSRYRDEHRDEPTPEKVHGAGHEQGMCHVAVR
jgi:hypothetical protein